MGRNGMALSHSNAWPGTNFRIQTLFADNDENVVKVV
jgi:hypothetical protein